MNIKAFHSFSVIEYLGEISGIVFCQGCNLGCFYCFNPGLIPKIKGDLSADEVVNTIAKCDLLTAIVITGGEPTIQPGLVTFIEKIKALGLKVKVETNGTRPEVLEKLITKKLVDFIQCDIKATLQNWEKVTKSHKVNYYLNKKSVEIIRHSKVPYLLRHVVYNEKDAEELLKLYPELELVTRRDI